MTDPLPPSAADRVAALRKPGQKRPKPAYTSKILTAGMSTTAMFGLVAAMGWHDSVGNAQAKPQAAPAPTSAPAPTPTSAPAPTPALAPTSAPTSAPAQAPATVPPVVVVPVGTPAPVVIPVAVPGAKQPQGNASAGTTSNVATKSSG